MEKEEMVASLSPQRIESLKIQIANVRHNTSNLSISQQISFMSIATGLKAIDVCKFLLAVEGDNAEVSRILGVLNKFYLK